MFSRNAGAMLVAPSMLLGANTEAADAPEATTIFGRIRDASDGDIEIFKGIPYGAPTGGAEPMRTTVPTSEDCLVLNVWTPVLRDKAKRPTMVWLHGGGFVSGSGASPVYDGTRLARRGDTVIVTINHRLNSFG